MFWWKQLSTLFSFCQLRKINFYSFCKEKFYIAISSKMTFSFLTLLADTSFFLLFMLIVNIKTFIWFIWNRRAKCSVDGQINLNWILINAYFCFFLFYLEYKLTISLINKRPDTFNHNKKSISLKLSLVCFFLSYFYSSVANCS